MKNTFDIVVVGGGSAGIGVAASLLNRDPKLQIAVIEPSEYHYYQPSWTLVGGGAFQVDDSRRTTKSVMPNQATWIQSSVSSFDPDSNTVTTDKNEILQYSELVVCPGLKIKWDAIEGLQDSLGKNGVTSNYSFEFAPYTWKLTQELQKGKALFTQPPMPIKCPGAPQKAMYLSCYEWFTKGRLNQIEVELHNAGGALFSVADFVPPLMDYVKKYNAKLEFNSNLVKIDGPNKKAYFANKAADGTVQTVEKDFDMLHVSPPQGPQEFMKNAPISNADGWVDVNQATMQHTKYPNVFGLGDACSTPNSKTAAAARKQVVVVADNIIAMRAGKAITAKYDGYGSCPLTVERGKVVLAEFGYGGKLLPTFPWLVNPLKATVLGWILKRDLLPWIYWNLMLKGREWFAKSSGN